MINYMEVQQIEELPQINRFENTMFDLPELYEDAFESMIESDHSDWDFIEDLDERSFDDLSIGSFQSDWM